MLVDLIKFDLVTPPEIQLNTQWKFLQRLPLIEVYRASIENSVGQPVTTSKGNKHYLAMLLSSQPTSCFAHELPFSVVNAGQPNSFSIEALYTSIGESPCKNFPSCKDKIFFLLY